ncbi:MAG TPA: chemotaxis protein CheW [Solirubrobacter sp.]|nr:chemotaxis protein CheW [Solirubrobacter sp.]
MRERASTESVALLCLDIAGRRWALPLDAVDRVVAMVAIEPLPGAPTGVCGAVNVHGEIVPVLDLDTRLGHPPREHRPEEALVLARTRGGLLALPADDVTGVIEVDAGAISPPPPHVPAPLAGLAALPEGVLLVSDLDAALAG